MPIQENIIFREISKIINNSISNNTIIDENNFITSYEENENFIIINMNLGYMEKLAKFPLALILALLCSFLPLNFIIFAAAALVLAHIYALSLEAALLVGILFLLMFLLYFRFSPGDTFVVILTNST